MEKFNALNENSKVAIFMHKTPDADAMGSAIGVEWLINKKFKSEVSLFHDGEISHPENKAMVNLLDLKFTELEKFNNNDFDYTICVDGTEQNSSLDQNVDCIIDHHNIEVDEKTYDFVLNENVGACCTLVYDLLKDFDLTLTDEDFLVSTSMLFGIIKDTNNLLSDSTTQKDIEAYQEISKTADKQKIFNIQTYPLPAYIFELESEAMKTENYIESEAAFVTFLGHISEAKRDALPYLADKYMRKEGISTSVVTAIVGDTLEASVRSDNVSLVLSNFLSNLFGSDYSGSKRGAGGAKVPLGFFSLNNEDKEYKEEIIDLVKKKIFLKAKREISKDS